MDTAERRDTSKSGNSSAPSFDAEYTEAPASLTTIYETLPLYSLINSLTNISDSLLAVPLPMAIHSILCLSQSLFSTSLDFSVWLWGFVGYITAVSSTLPLPSTTASLQPVL